MIPIETQTAAPKRSTLDEELLAAFEIVADEPVPDRLFELARELETAARMAAKKANGKLH
ncbi:hypothetical protein LB572_06755 [Mesorhizobium sp. BH1-1-5]|uniref:hypothetical protein n=1 Tax=Mesorhizobium sp. BH1-1-5 TaxID=2876661 RepID=UPI001CCDB487|nr:hypothetical protein [Mesorhizobium sp. BH1-1-5]MBZ9986792.1 hypothetical protein [Mesorhizobium sp. BH1-1-5]